ncbi:unnamed protein product, partial [Rotaria sordida]
PIFINLFLSNTNLQSFQYETGDPNSGEDPRSGKTKYFTPSSFYPTSTKTILSQLTDITIPIQKFQDIIWLFTIAPNVKLLKVDRYKSVMRSHPTNTKRQLKNFIQPKNLEEFHLKCM